MKSEAVFCVLLLMAIVPWVELRTTAECDKLVADYAKTIAKDKTKDCEKYDELKACFLENKTMTRIMAFDHLDKLETAVRVQKFSCQMRCANITVYQACQNPAKGPKRPLGDPSPNREAACTSYNSELVCLRKAGCSGDGLKEVTNMVDLVLRNTSHMFCKPCEDEKAMESCRTQIDGIGKNKTVAGECPLYNKMKECFTNKAKCSRLATKQEMDVADAKLAGITCSTKCANVQARNDCQKKGLDVLFKTDDNTFKKDFICGTAEKEMRDCFTKQGKCSTTLEDEVAQMKGFRSDMGFCNSASSMAASILTILMGAFLSSLH